MATTQNLLTYSEDFNYWSKTNITVNTDIAANPLTGTQTADRLNDSADGVASSHYITRSSLDLARGSIRTASVYAKAGTLSQIRLDLGGGTNTAMFNLNAGTIVSTSGLNPIARIYPVTGAAGWYFCSFTATMNNSSNGIFYIWTAKSGTNSYTGDGYGTVILYGAQLTTSNWEGNYYATAATANPYGSIYYKVPVKQNLFKYSEQFDQSSVYTYSNATITANTVDTLDPVGTNTADIVVENAVLGYHYVAQTPVAVSAIADNTVLIASIYAKKATRDYLQIYSCAGLVAAWFNLSTGVIGAGASAPRYISHGMVSVGNGWYRCWVAYKYINAYRAVNFIANTANSETTYQGVLNQKAIYLWGAQLEQANSIGPYTQTITFPYNYGARRSLAL